MNIPQGRKIPVPRKLDKQETAASLRLWKVHFQNYYKNDVYFKRFISDTAVWHVHQVNWGFTPEAADSQLKRTAEELKSDCNMFLETLASFLPDDYLVEKIIRNTSKLADIWRILEDFYGVTLNSETFLGLAKMQKQQSETYRQFYLRMEGFVSKHLTKGGVKVEEITTPARGDTLTISMKNLLVILWMQKIHDRLIDCVRIDFSQELRAGRELIELMNRIADNVDSILARHDLSSGVSTIKQGEEDGGDMHNVQRIGEYKGTRGGRGGRGGRRDSRGGKTAPSGPGKQLQCSHCEYLSNTLRLKINSNHEPSECWRKDIAVRLIKSEDDTEDSFSSAEDLGENMDTSNSSPNTSHLLQIEAVTDGTRESTLDNGSPAHPPILSEKEDIYHQILKIQRSLLDSEVGSAQAKSPTLKVSLHGHKVPATIDEGSELNCISLRLTNKCSLEITKTENKARAADSSRLRLVGQLKKPLLLVAEPHGTPIRLKHVVVVDQLNADLLIGEPGKRDNDIVTYAAKKEISIPFRQDRHVYTYEQGRGPVTRVARVPSSTVTYPGENYFWPVPDMYAHLRHLQILPRHNTQPWFNADTCQIQHGKICIKNTSDSPVFLKRGTAFADVMTVSCVNTPVSTWEELRDGLPDLEDMDEENLLSEAPHMGSMVDLEEILANIQRTEASVDMVYDTYPDQNQYVAAGDKAHLGVDHTDKIQLDPDNILTPEQRTTFRRLCKEFKDVIRPEPGRYNGRFGHISNRINFAAKPAPNSKIYQ